MKELVLVNINSLVCNDEGKSCSLFTHVYIKSPRERICRSMSTNRYRILGIKHICSMTGASAALCLLVVTLTLESLQLTRIHKS